MHLSHIKQHLGQIDQLQFTLPNGNHVPAHFHVTEVGVVQRTFIDCGGTVRREEAISLQLWQGPDVHHRLAAEKLRSIIELAERQLALPNASVEVEYQGTMTLQTYGLQPTDTGFALTPQYTDCLAKETCGVPDSEAAGACAPGSGCC